MATRVMRAGVTSAIRNKVARTRVVRNGVTRARAMGTDSQGSKVLGSQWP